MQRDTEQEVESYLRRRFESLIQSVDVLEKEDLSLVRAACPCLCCWLGAQRLTRRIAPQNNHLSGLRRKYLKVCGRTTRVPTHTPHAHERVLKRIDLCHPRLQVSFATTQELMDVRRELMPLVARNKAAAEAEARIPFRLPCACHVPWLLG